MIFVTVGSQKFQFNRLLEELDKLMEEKKIKDNIIAQIGYCTYIPKNFKFEKFLDRDKFNETMKECNLLITHGGTGAIIAGVKKSKKVIAIPRDKKYGEHVDNHQYDIVNQFSDMNLIYGLKEINELENAINKVNDLNFKKYISNTENVIQSIEAFIENF
ncbi:PssE/Cps14G family polysaccharide biosynthesis glycosyltransferase [Clostridium perfringens]|uniref:PssE/Cps14G family polysaccharide biosynthesis glycosyltransferase n=1 Tax=Clostridium perfringens TaxID=1502 RepID=UPI001FADC765|nr:PssE/Cps14G family polysaccharide biosynthesis glycosyltransferase [Clostridium perfringens]